MKRTDFALLTIETTLHSLSDILRRAVDRLDEDPDPRLEAFCLELRKLYVRLARNHYPTET